MDKLVLPAEFVQVGGDPFDGGGRAFAPVLERRSSRQRFDCPANVNQGPGADVAAEFVKRRLNFQQLLGTEDPRFLAKLQRLSRQRRLADFMTADGELRPIGQVQLLEARQSTDETGLVRKLFSEGGQP